MGTQRGLDRIDDLWRHRHQAEHGTKDASQAGARSHHRPHARMVAGHLLAQLRQRFEPGGEAVPLTREPCLLALRGLQLLTGCGGFLVQPCHFSLRPLTTLRRLLDLRREILGALGQARPALVQARLRLGHLFLFGGQPFAALIDLLGACP